MEAIPGVGPVQERLQPGEPHGRVGADRIEVVHQHGLGEHRQLAKRGAVQAVMELPVERRLGGRERAQRRGFPPLVLPQRLLAPVFPVAQGTPQPQHP
jgi:hypothetical protein